ncbi:MAG: transposase [Sedimentisphaerales bacterium]|nr:transposase [Sedimentisphaerales bacterium]MBN2842867.1 transposase [Sedimentisphaerales bacterium]
MKDIFYNQNSDLEVSSRNLPHWQQNGKMYFITFRTADSIPEDKLVELQIRQREFEKNNCKPYSKEQEKEYRHLFFERIEEWLDNAYGACVLKDRRYSEVVKNALEYYNGKKYILDHWVIMPNHVHILMLLLEGFDLKDIMHSWKSYTATQINRLNGSKGQFWQHESFDHIIRSEYFLDKYREYIIQNRLSTGIKDLQYGSQVAQASLLEIKDPEEEKK